MEARRNQTSLYRNKDRRVPETGGAAGLAILPHHVLGGQERRQALRHDCVIGAGGQGSGHENLMGLMSMCAADLPPSPGRKGENRSAALPRRR
jgi:hypothetical protein